MLFYFNLNEIINNAYNTPTNCIICIVHKILNYLYRGDIIYLGTYIKSKNYLFLLH